MHFCSSSQPTKQSTTTTIKLLFFFTIKQSTKQSTITTINMAPDIIVSHGKRRICPRDERTRLQRRRRLLLLPSVSLLLVLVFLSSQFEPIACESTISSAANTDTTLSLSPTLSHLSKKEQIGVKEAIHLFQKDVQYFKSLPECDLTTPCPQTCRDTTYTRIWTLQDWKGERVRVLDCSRVEGREREIWGTEKKDFGFITLLVVQELCFHFIIILIHSFIHPSIHPYLYLVH